MDNDNFPKWPPEPEPEEKAPEPHQWTGFPQTSSTATSGSEATTTVTPEPSAVTTATPAPKPNDKPKPPAKEVAKADKAVDKAEDAAEEAHANQATILARAALRADPDGADAVFIRKIRAAHVDEREQVINDELFHYRNVTDSVDWNMVEIEDRRLRDLIVAVVKD